MKTEFNDNPRKFTVGEIEISDYGKIVLDENEMISMKTPNGSECDITAKVWGYYLGASLNGRMQQFGFKTALVQNSYNKLYINVVESDKLEEFNDYLEEQNSRIICWLDELDVSDDKDPLI